MANNIKFIKRHECQLSQTSERTVWNMIGIEDLQALLNHEIALDGSLAPFIRVNSIRFAKRTRYARRKAQSKRGHLAVAMDRWMQWMR